MSTNLTPSQNNPGPLSTVTPGNEDANSFDFNDFTYPIDLGANPGLNHYVIFYINESKNTQYKFDPKSMPTGSQPSNPIAIAVNNAGGVNPNSQLNVNQFSDLNTGNLAGQTNTFSANNIRNTSTKTKLAIALYMPPNIVSNYSANWSEMDLGVAGDVGQAMRTNWDKLQSGDKGTLMALFGTIPGLLKSIGSNLFREADNLTGLNLTSVAESSLRMAFNPHQEVLFHGIRFRAFQFDFKFTPRSEDEAIVADNIIQAFKFYAAPEINQGITGPFFIYPAEFDIQFFSGGKPNTFLNKISTCALTGISVNYTANGMFTAFKPVSNTINGVTVETNLTLQFTELELMTKARIKDGF